MENIRDVAETSFDPVEDSDADPGFKLSFFEYCAGNAHAYV